MKTIFTLLSGLMLSLTALAAPANYDLRTKNMLSIKSYGQGDIRIVIDGKRFDPRHNSIAIRNIRSGYHSVKIYQQRNTGFFGMNRNRYEKVFNRSVMIRNNTNLVITIDRFGNASIDQRKMKDKGRDYDWNKNKENRRDNDKDDDFNRDNEFDRDIEYDGDNDFDKSRGINEEQFEFDFDRDGNSGDYDFENEIDDRDSKSMNDREFNTMMQSIQKEWFEGNKVKSASQIISSNYFTSAQVKQMLQTFNFENNKLDLAKQAFSKTVDPGNYLMTLNDVFSFNSSKDELARFVRGYR